MYIQQVATKNKLSSFDFENFILKTIISSLENKNYYYIVILFLCYVFRFASKGFVIFSNHTQSDGQMNLLLSTSVFLCDILTILIHHVVFFFSTLSQKDKFYVKKKSNTQSSCIIFFSYFMSDGPIF